MHDEQRARPAQIGGEGEAVMAEEALASTASGGASRSSSAKSAFFSASCSGAHSCT